MIISGQKRKAIEYTNDLQYPDKRLAGDIMTKRRTFPLGFSSSSSSSPENDAMIITTTTSHPRVEAFRLQLMDSINRQVPLFGTTYASGLESLHAEVYVHLKTFMNDV